MYSTRRKTYLTSPLIDISPLNVLPLSQSVSHSLPHAATHLYIVHACEKMLYTSFYYCFVVKTCINSCVFNTFQFSIKLHCSTCQELPTSVESNTNVNSCLASMSITFFSSALVSMETSKPLSIPSGLPSFKREDDEEAEEVACTLTSCLVKAITT